MVSPVETLHKHGASMLRVHPSKAPAEAKGWPERQLSLDDALAWQGQGGLVGVQPSSIELTALDVDAGTPTELLEEVTPMAVCPTRRAGGLHLYFHSQLEYTGRRWAHKGASGDIRGRQGAYVVLWAGQPLADALDKGTPGDDFADVARLLDYPVAPSSGKTDVADGEEQGRHAYVLQRLVEARINGITPDEAIALAMRLWREAPQPPNASHTFPVDEALAIATWVAAHSWSSDAQRERGVISGQAARARNGLRNSAITRMLNEGHTIDKVAVVFGVSRDTVKRTKKLARGLV